MASLVTTTVAGTLSVKLDAGLTLERTSVESRFRMFNTGGEWILASTFGNNGAYDPIKFQTSDTTRLTIAANGTATFSGALTGTTATFSGGVTAAAANGFTAGTAFFYSASSIDRFGGNAATTRLYANGSQVLELTSTGLAVTGAGTFSGSVAMNGTDNTSGVLTASTYSNFKFQGANTSNYGANVELTSPDGTLLQICRAGRRDGGTSNDVYLRTGLSTSLKLGTNNTTHLTISAAGVSTFSGALTVGGNINKTGDLTVDVSGDILLDADGADIRFLDGGTDYFKFTKDGNNSVIKSQVSDGDFIIRGSDAGVQIDALTFDMSAAGAATFSGALAAGSGSFAGHVTPASNISYNLGSSGARWLTIYGSAGNFSGDITGTSSLFRLNNSEGANVQLISYGFLSCTKSGQYSSAGFNSRADIGASNTWEIANTHGSCGFADIRFMGYSTGITFNAKTGAVTSGDNITSDANQVLQLKPDKSALFGGDITLADDLYFKSTNAWIIAGSVAGGALTGGTLRIQNFGELEVDGVLDVNGSGASMFADGGSVSTPALWYRPSTTAVHCWQPKNAYYHAGGNVHTGAIRIKMPPIHDAMITFWVDVYDYASNESFTAYISCYPYVSGGSPTYSHTSAVIIGGVARNFTVRFGDNNSASSTEYYVYIGETNSTWNHPQVVVRDVFSGFATSSADWEGGDTGWGVSFATSFENVAATRSSTLPYGDYNKLLNTPTLSFLPLTGGTLTGTLTSRTIAPSADSTYDLGENTARYANLFVDSITCGGASTFGDFLTVNNGYSGPDGNTGYRLKFVDHGGVHNDCGIGVSGSSGAERMWFNALNGFEWNIGTYGVKLTLTSAGLLTTAGGVTVGGDIQMTTAATSSKIRFGTSSWGNNIGLESYWSVHQTNRNEGWLFRDTDNVELLRIFGSNNGTTPRQATFGGTLKATTLTLSTGTIVHGSTTVLNSSRELINIAELAINATAAGSWKLYCNGIAYFNGNVIIGRNQSMNPRLVLSSAAKSANLGKADTGMALCIDSGTSDNNQSVGHLSQIGLGLINTYQPAAIGAMVSNAAAYTSTHLVFATRPTTTDVAPTERMRIQDDGNVGIGTTSASNLLSVHWTLGGYAKLAYATDKWGGFQFVENGTTKAYIDYGAYQATDGFTFYAGGGSSSDVAMKIKEGGAVIIAGGNAEPTSGFKLDVNGYTRTSLLTFRTSAAGVGGTVADENSYELGPGYLNLSRDDTTAARQIQFGKNGSLHSGLMTDTNGLNFVGSDGAADVTIKTDGNVGIGETNPGAKLTVAGNAIITSSNPLFMGGNGTAIGSWVSKQYATGQNHYLGCNGFQINNAGYVSPATTFLQIYSTGQAIFKSIVNNHNYHYIDTTSGGYNPILGFLEAGTRRGYINYVSADNYLSITTEEGSSDIAIMAAGKVGVGTTAPGAKLHVYGGNIRISSTDDKPQLEFFETAAARWVIGHSNAPNNHFAISEGSDIAASERLVIAPTTGSVGIGTTSPSKLLEVNGPIRATNSTTGGKSYFYMGAVKPGETYEYDAGGMSAIYPTSGWNSLIVALLGPSLNGYSTPLEYMTFSSNGTTRLTSMNGNVGIGTTVPDRLLHLYGGASGQATPVASAQLVLEDNGSNNYITFLNPNTGNAGIMWGDPQDSARAQLIYDHNAGHMKFNPGGAETVWFESSGNVGIGTNDPGETLHVYGSTYGRIKIQTTSANSHAILFLQNDAQTWDVRVNGANADSFEIVDSTGTQTSRFVVQTDGNVGIGDTTPNYKLDVNGTFRVVGASVFGNISSNLYPSADSTYSMGDNTTRWSAVFADTLYGNGANITSLNASNLSSGTVAAARLGSGSSITSKFLRGDNTWQTVSSGGSGTVTSVATTGAITGGTITTSGTIAHSTSAGYKHVPSGGSSGQFLKYSSSGTAVWAGGVLNTDFYVHVGMRTTAASGTDGGTLTSNTWTTRDLNHTYTNNGGFATVSTSNNTVTLDAGTYYVRFWATGYGVQEHQAQFYNSTDSYVYLNGSNQRPSSSLENSNSIGSGIVSFGGPGTKAFLIRHIVDYTRATYGGGRHLDYDDITSGNFSYNTYWGLEIWKVG